MLGCRYDARTLERRKMINWIIADEPLAVAAVTLAHEHAVGPTVAHTATRTLVTIAINKGVGAGDMAMTELQKPLFRSEDFRARVDSFNQNVPGMACFEGR